MLALVVKSEGFPGAFPVAVGAVKPFLGPVVAGHFNYNPLNYYNLPGTPVNKHLK